MQKIYLLSGLGADQRVFNKLSLRGVLIHIQWITPNPSETFAAYCKRLVQVNNIEENQIVIGLSMGGIIAIEISKIIPLKQVIIISSVKNRTEMPLLFRLASHLRLYKLLPYFLLRKPSFLLRFAFSPLSKDDYSLLKKIVADTDTAFLKWAIEQIALWPSTTHTHNLTHLHGTADKIFLKRNLKDYIPVKDGGHFMVYNRAEEISLILNKLL